MFKKSLALAAAVAVSALSVGTVYAQGGPPAQLPGQMDPSRVQAGTYKSDPNHSMIGWRINHFGFTDYLGLFGDVAATLTIDPANPAGAKVDAVIPINPVLANQGLHDHLVRPGKDGGKPDFFGPSQAPAHFVSTSVTPGPNNTARINGNLTMNGITKPVTIEARFTGAGTSMTRKLTVGFSGKTTIHRSDWGLTTFLPMVGDNVELDIIVAFEKQ